MFDLGKEELATKLAVTTMITDYLSVILWFNAVQLLPEHSGMFDKHPQFI